MIVTIGQAVKIAGKYRKQGKKIVTTNGCFDILHIGHLSYLKKARNMGDVLIVGINGDKSPYFKSKTGRPIVPEKERAEMLDALKSVDYVFIFNDGTPNRWVKKIKPDFHVKACDSGYGIEQCVERFAVQEGGGKVVLVPKTSGKSTTKIIDRVLATYKATYKKR